MAGNQQETDRAIRDAMLEDTAHALEMLWESYSGRLHGYLVSLLCSHHDAEEVLQEVFVKIARNPSAVAGARNLAGFIFTIARNEAVSALRRRRKTPAPADAMNLWLIPAEQQGNTGEENNAIARALAGLPEEQRTVIILKVYRDMTFQEIADSLGISLNTAASRYRYGLEKLRLSVGGARQ